MNSHPDNPCGAALLVELSQLDLRYEGCRLKSPAAEARLLAAIAQSGIQQPLQGVEGSSARILLNGFKRLRCAKKLHLHTAPFVSLAKDEAAGIVCLLRTANDHALSLLEQARFLDELKATIPVQSITEVTAEIIARVGGEQAAKGINLPLADLISGACALELG